MQLGRPVVLCALLLPLQIAEAQDGSKPIEIERTSDTVTITFGTTVISHGFSSSGWEGGPKPWMLAMATDIVTAAGQGQILEYESTTGSFVRLAAAPSGASNSGESVLLFNWAEESGMLHEGFSEAAADALFASLLLGERNGDFQLDSLHLIGHSRGTVINSEVAQRMSAIGYSVGHITHLDPHDWGALGTVQDFDVNPGLSIAFPSGTTPNSGAVAWQGTEFVDTYYQQNVAFGDAIPDPPRPGCATFRFLPELNGRPLLGAYNEEWTCRPEPDNPSTNVTHSGMHEAYRETILSGEETGYFYSRLGGGAGVRPDDNAIDRVNNTFSFETEGIVNGDFERGTIPGDTGGLQPRPGWSIHGGGGIGGSITGPYLRLADGQSWREHNRFLIPVSADSIRYSVRVEAASTGTPPDADRLAVYLRVVGGEAQLVDEVWLDQVQDWRVRSIDALSFRDEIVTLRFEIEPFGEVDSEVWIDDVAFAPLATSIAADVRVFLQGPFDGSSQMKALLGTSIPTTHPYSARPWGYSGSQTVAPGFFESHPEIVDWVYLQFRSDTTTVVSESVGLLREDGQVVSHYDGLSPVVIDAPPGWYYVVIDHVNHLAVMSSAPVDFTGSVGSFSFADDTAAYGNDPQVDLGEGFGPYGMWAADANADGKVDAVDFSEYISQTTNGSVGHQPADFNLDGAVQALDANLNIANALEGASSQVP